MTDATWVSLLGLGLILGLRHALDPDHIVAVSTMVSECGSVRRSSLVGTFWGLGHTLALLLAGILVITFKVQLSQRFALWMEFVVALMLILLGINALLKPLRGWKVHVHRHSHDGSSHIHVHMHCSGEKHVHRHPHPVGFGLRSLLIGMIHGLAGSAALMILVLATIPSALAGLIYIAVFGLGSVGGMLLMSSLLSLPFVITKNRSSGLSHGLQLTAGFISLLLGLLIVGQYGFREHNLF